MDIHAFGFAVARRPGRSDGRGAGPGRDGDTFDEGSLRLCAGENAYTREALQDRLPLITPQVMFVYEGRVDNRSAVAARLGRPELAGASDGTVLVAAYEAWGLELPQHVVGEYSYAVYDRRRRLIAGGQDGLGIRKLFYGERDGWLWIASDLRFAFARFPALRPPLDGDTLPEYFSGPFTPWSGRTIWKNVRQLSRGRGVEQAGPTLRERQVWQLTPRTWSATRADEVDDAFRSHLFEAVRGALRSDRPLLCDVSGGYDSTTVFAVAQHLRRGTDAFPPLVPWAFRNRTGNEDQFRDAVIAEFGTPIYLIDRLTCLPFQYLDPAAELPAGGFIQAGALTQAVRAFAGAQGLRSRLTGLAADVLFHKGGPPLHLAEWIRAGRLRDWARHVRGYLRTGSVSLWHLLTDCTIGSVDLLAATFPLEPPDWMPAAFLTKVRDAQREFLRMPRMLRGCAREFVYRHTVFQLPYHERMLPDQRFPLVSLPLVEFVLGVDWKFLVRPGETRVLMRRALAGILPETVRAGGTIARHNAAIFEGLRVAWPRVQHLLTGERLGAFGAVDPHRFRAAIERMRSGYGGPHQAYLLTALYLEAWLAIKARAAPACAATLPDLDRQGDAR